MAQRDYRALDTVESVMSLQSHMNVFTSSNVCKSCDLNLDEVNHLLQYDTETGLLKWRSSGKVAGGVNQRGYRTLTIKTKTYQAQRIIWFMVTGEYPIEMIGFKNKNKQDLVFSNLVEVTHETKHKV